MSIEEDVMSEEAFNELIDNFEVVEKITMFGRKSIKYYVKKMQAEREQDKKRMQELEKEKKRKDMFMEMAKEVVENSILKQKVKDKIEEYFEDEEWLIEHDLKALCDDEKECREYYINKKIALKDIKKNILDKLNKLLNNY